MSVLRAIETRIEGLFEGVFGRAFRTHVQPVELARKLAKEMDENRSVSVSRVVSSGCVVSMTRASGLNHG